MPVRKTTVSEYKRKKQNQARSFLKGLSNSNIKGRQASTISDVKSKKPIFLGGVLARNTRSVASRKEAIVEIDKEISNLFSGKKTSIHAALKRLPKKEREIVTKYASVRIGKILTILAKRNLSSKRNTSSSFSLSERQKKVLFDLLSQVNGVNKSTLEKSIKNQSALSLKIQEHTQFMISQFFEKYVLTDSPRMSSRRAVDRIKLAIRKCNTFEEFYKYLNNPEKKGDKKSTGKNKIMRLSGLQIEIGGKQLIFSKGKDRPSTLIHEAVHNVLNNSGLVDLSWSESFTHFLAMNVSKKTGVEVDYLSEGQRKKFNTVPHTAIANFPWSEVTARDVSWLASNIRKEINSIKGIENSSYYSFYSSLTPKVSKYYFQLLARKLPTYSKKDRAIVRQIALKGIRDCEGKKNLNYLKRQLQRTYELAK